LFRELGGRLSHVAETERMKAEKIARIKAEARMLKGNRRALCGSPERQSMQQL